MNKTWQRLAAAMALTLATSVGYAATPDSVRETKPQNDTVNPQIWRVDGGDMRMRFNDSYLDLLGIEIEFSAAVFDKQNPEFAIFPVLSTGGLRLNAPDGGFDRFVDGALTLHGGFEISLADGSRIDLRDAKLRPSVENLARMELVGKDGVVWLYVNHVMYKFGQDYGTFDVRSADLRASGALAKRVGEPALANAYVGELQFSSRVMERSREIAARPKGNAPIFHGMVVGGLTYEADVLMSTFDLEFMRCRRSNQTTNGCDGVGADDGEVVFAPNATLVNSNKANTADVPWYQKFTTSPYSYPYSGNDQHPFLIWNVLRTVDGQLEMIGTSGTKHAFLTINVGCAPGAFTGNGHILGKNCSDTYGTGNNDNTNDLGPRSEILPAPAHWGRCGSIFDIDCNGSSDGSGSVAARCTEAGGSGYCNRMRIRESQMQVPGATYQSEAWYIVQDDVNIYNTMGRRSMTPASNGSLWVPGSQGSLSLGPVINGWVDPVANPTANVEFNSAGFGRARVAVKVKTLNACPAGSGLTGTCYRYDYAVHNFDFASGEVTGTPPNRRVTDAKGFDSFRIGLSVGSTVYAEPDVNFADTDTNPANNWTVNVGAGAIEWSAPAGASLGWGTLYRFSLVSNIAPSSELVQVALRPGNTSQGATTLMGSLIGPAGLANGIMKNGFEG